MPEYLHPGVYVEERRSGLAPIQGVSTSNMGIVGFTPRGPSDEATLVTSYTEFADRFGDFTPDSQVPTHVYAFFANGGRRCYVVRVTGAGSAASTGNIQSEWAEEEIATGDGATVAMDSAAPTIGEVDIAHTLITPGSVSVTYNRNEFGTAVLGDAISGVAPNMTLTIPSGPFTASMVGKQITIAGATTPANDGSFTILTVVGTTQVTYTNGAGAAEPLVGTWAVSVVAQASDLAPTPNGILVSFAGKLGGTADTKIAPGTVSINVIAAPKTYTDPAKDGVLVDSAAPLVPLGRVDYNTGHFSLTMVAAPVNAADVTYDYATQGAIITVTDDGVGGWNAPATAGAIAYDTGVWSMTVPLAPQDALPVKVDYSQQIDAVTAISDGEWGDDVRIDVRGDEDYFVRATATYTRYDLLVYLLNEDGDYELKETFDNLSFTDPTDARYVTSIVNNEGVGSDYIDMTEPMNESVAPRSLSGYSRQRAVGAGNGTQSQFGSSGATPVIPNPFVTNALDTPVQAGSVSIRYVDTAGVIRTITDDGAGNLTGDVDPGAAVGFNEIDYTTGQFAFATGDGLASVAIGTYAQAGASCLPIITYYKVADETTQQDSMTGGLDGAALTRAQLTSPALSADREGMYALLTTDELINLTIPDAAGNVTMANDEVTEAERNEKWFVILASPPGYNKQQVKDWRINTLGITSSYAALYWPYITITDPVTDLPTNIPPGGHIAGVYARTDNAKSVGKAPAGTEDGRLLFATGIETRVEWADIDILHPNQINSIVNTPQTGLCVWGCRTLERPPADFRYVHVRRLFNFLKASIFNSTHGFVFDNVGAPLWSRIRMSVESFLLVLFQQGLFAGNTPSDAYLVICDETNNPKAVQDAGFVITDIYVAPNTPGEFIVFRIQQKVAQAA